MSGMGFRSNFILMGNYYSGLAMQKVLNMVNRLSFIRTVNYVVWRLAIITDDPMGKLLNMMNQVIWSKSSFMCMAIR